MRLTLEFDGGSRGNPGPAGAGVVLRADDGAPLVAVGRFIGRATNNVAEYRALIAGLEKAIELGATRLDVFGDSELIIRQMTGRYRVKHPDLVPLHRKAAELAARIGEVRFEHNLRHHNRLADRLANLAMDRRADVDDADEPPTPQAPPLEAGEVHECPRCGAVIEVRKMPESQERHAGAFTCICGATMNRGG